MTFQSVSEKVRERVTYRDATHLKIVWSICGSNHHADHVWWNRKRMMMRWWDRRIDGWKETRWIITFVPSNKSWRPGVAGPWRRWDTWQQDRRTDKAQEWVREEVGYILPLANICFPRKDYCRRTYWSWTDVMRPTSTPTGSSTSGTLRYTYCAGQISGY